MGILDKDIVQKEAAIRFCLAAGMVPFLEVNVGNRKELSSVSTVITDIDALGVAIDPSGNLRRVIFDCKTLGKTSPINRAFWASGLMSYAGCNEAFVILRKSASEAHRLSAKYLSVHLFSEEQFSSFSKSYSIESSQDSYYASSINNWVKLHGFYSKGSVFDKFGEFLSHEVSLEEDASRGVKRLLAALKKGRGEFVPERDWHVSVFFHAVMAFSFLMARVVHDLKTVIDFGSSKDEFENILRYYIWGGRESFRQKQKMAELFATVKSDGKPASMDIPDWDGFVELTRKLLDSPKDVFLCCFPLCELSLRFNENLDDDKETKLAELLYSNSRLRQFIVFQADYLVSAGQIPKEFSGVIRAIFDKLRERV